MQKALPINLLALPNWSRYSQTSHAETHNRPSSFCCRESQHQLDSPAASDAPPDFFAPPVEFIDPLVVEWQNSSDNVTAPTHSSSAYISLCHLTGLISASAANVLPPTADGELHLSFSFALLPTIYAENATRAGFHGLWKLDSRLGLAAGGHLPSSTLGLCQVRAPESGYSDGTWRSIRFRICSRFSFVRGRLARGSLGVVQPRSTFLISV